MTRAGAGERHPYPHLARLLAGWFHQDFDLDGDTLEEILAAYRRSESAAEIEGARQDIAAFMAKAGGALEQAFDDTFEVEIEPTGFAASTRAFLERVAELLGRRA